ncbi:hypothetical protein DFQ28_009153 [Apophysomyces sp. BC1034]|nr:hypothetical protein DFQ30_004958 [Apophysomyces sp. BC1015]KAG0173778.1 hypothetical protein DFQ29_007755 [Apophysomyces sp. BC1021]KAG0185554.1 hypothetical protein DFQ28_009153 [Apophysomyces sp. BC1034]
MPEYPIRLEKGVVPTKDTNVILAGTIRVPPIAVGTWQWGDTDFWDWTPEAEQDAKEAFDTAHELGVPFYDTAEVYGKGESEREIKRFREHYSDDEKEKQVIATKFFPEKDRVQYPDVLLSALKDSLARLGMQKADLYQIHMPIHDASIEVVADALADAYDAGLVKTVGVSNYSADEVKRMHAALKKRNIQLASNQISFSLIRTIPEKANIIKTCHDLGVAVLAFSALGMGLLTGKYSAEGPFPKPRDVFFDKLDKPQLRRLLATLKGLAEKYEKPQSAIALNWCMMKGTIPLAGARKASHVRQNDTALGFALSEEDIAALDKDSFEGSFNDYQHG